MKKINNFISASTAILVAIIIICTYEIKTISFPSWVKYTIAIISPFIGIGTASLISFTLMRFPYIRKIICKDGWIEGYWIIETTPLNNTEEEINSFLVNPGILLLEYKTRSFDIKTVTFRLDDNNNIYLNKSEVAYQRENSENLKYLHYFKGNKQGVSYEGIASGEVSKLPKGRTLLSGKVYLEHEGITREQTGYRLDKKTLSELRNKLGNDDVWIKKLLESHCDINLCLGRVIQ